MEIDITDALALLAGLVREARDGSMNVTFGGKALAVRDFINESQSEYQVQLITKKGDIVMDSALFVRDTDRIMLQKFIKIDD